MCKGQSIEFKKIQMSKSTVAKNKKKTTNAVVGFELSTLCLKISDLLRGDIFQKLLLA